MVRPNLTGSWWVFGSGITNNKAEYGMTDIHSCSYYCERPECVRAQRDELRDRQWVSLTDAEMCECYNSPNVGYAVEAKLKEKNT